MSLNKHGIKILNNVIKDNVYLDNINEKLYEWLEEKNQRYNRTDSCLHHLLVYDKTLFNKILTILGRNKDIKNYFKTGFIMHSCGAVINQPKKTAYTHNWHIDTYEETNENVMLNVLVPLVDFTIENGCTKIYPKDGDSYEQIQLKKGDILLFNSGLKHCTGNNKSKLDRNCITITLIKMYMKPQFDYLKLFTDKELTVLDDKIKVLINYYSQLPSNLEDFYNKTYKLLIKG